MVRKDLPPEQQTVQAVHAAFDSGKYFANPNDCDTPSVVICSVSDEQELIQAVHRLTRRNVDHVLFTEPDMGHEATALATAPINGKTRRIFSNYQLWRE